MSNQKTSEPDDVVAELIARPTAGVETAMRAAEEIESIYYRAVAATTAEPRVTTAARSPKLGVDLP